MGGYSRCHFLFQERECGWVLDREWFLGLGMECVCDFLVLLGGFIASGEGSGEFKSYGVPG